MSTQMIVAMWHQSAGSSGVRHSPTRRSTFLRPNVEVLAPSV